MIPVTTQITNEHRKLFLQTTKILNTNSLHFITISILFLPFTFFVSTIIQLCISPTSSSHDVTTNHLIKTIISTPHLPTSKILISILVLFLLTSLPIVASTALIIYSTNQAMQRKHVIFISAFKSLSHSYIPLLTTFISGFTKITLIFILYTLSPLAITQVVKSLGFHFDGSIFSIFINIILAYALILIIFFLITIWGSAAPIAVLEATSGFEPLQQSAHQSPEFQYHSASILFITYLAFVPLLSYANSANDIGSETKGITILVAIYFQSSLMMLHYVVANTVLYLQCKAAVVDGVSDKYVTVVVTENDDQEGGHEVTLKDIATGGFSYTIYLFLIVWAILYCFMLG